MKKSVESLEINQETIKKDIEVFLSKNIIYMPCNEEINKAINIFFEFYEYYHSNGILDVLNTSDSVFIKSDRELIKLQKFINDNKIKGNLLHFEGNKFPKLSSITLRTKINEVEIKASLLLQFFHYAIMHDKRIQNSIKRKIDKESLSKRRSSRLNEFKHILVKSLYKCMKENHIGSANKLHKKIGELAEIVEVIYDEKQIKDILNPKAKKKKKPEEA